MFGKYDSTTKSDSNCDWRTRPRTEMRNGTPLHGGVRKPFVGCLQNGSKTGLRYTVRDYQAMHSYILSSQCISHSTKGFGRVETIRWRHNEQNSTTNFRYMGHVAIPLSNSHMIHNG